MRIATNIGGDTLKPLRNLCYNIKQPGSGNKKPFISYRCNIFLRWNCSSYGQKFADISV